MASSQTVILPVVLKMPFIKLYHMFYIHVYHILRQISIMEMSTNLYLKIKYGSYNVGVRFHFTFNTFAITSKNKHHFLMP